VLDCKARIQEQSFLIFAGGLLAVSRKSMDFFQCLAESTIGHELCYSGVAQKLLWHAIDWRAC
jgi:hypothetical protein